MSVNELKIQITYIFKWLFKLEMTEMCIKFLQIWAKTKKCSIFSLKND